jgi:hypothetical protein
MVFVTDDWSSDAVAVDWRNLDEEDFSYIMSYSRNIFLQGFGRSFSFFSCKDYNEQGFSCFI